MNLRPTLSEFTEICRCARPLEGKPERHALASPETGKET
jgi:hypothetical protein